ncbi:hypothetical protein [Candidatus Protochlamydia phocaeensis]|uniref:hypothetical protein n=1 Tax=Candidatus Protochlamydia phocaeensis TaxID=1414722 RepID=UPI0008393582|nr:hypothetical protein [Candidatus Protochlamydia phocaeensis]
MNIEKLKDYCVASAYFTSNFIVTFPIVYPSLRMIDMIAKGVFSNMPARHFIPVISITIMSTTLSIILMKRIMNVFFSRGLAVIQNGRNAPFPPWTPKFSSILLG